MVDIKKRKEAGADSSAVAPSLEDILQRAGKSQDFHQFSPFEGETYIQVSYYKSMVDEQKLTLSLLPALQQNRSALSHPHDMKEILPFDDMLLTNEPREIESKLCTGYLLLQFSAATDAECLLVNIRNDTLGQRTSNDTENEFSVVGPKAGFVENLDTNLHLLRQQMPVPELIFRELTMGSISKTRVAYVYLDGVTNPQLIETVEQRLTSIDFEIFFDSSQIDQLIADKSNTPFPLFLSTERIDRVAFAISSGQVAIFSNGSPYGVTGPSNFLDFFISPEDYYLPWILGSFFRLIRIISVIFSIFAAPLYVAVLTYHFEVLPDSILGPLIMSRLHVPLPPVMEVIFLEITIELLREAGARLPTKIGQTLGIVGGIVIGEASVRAALTSNILIIIVAFSALASFTTPIFKMANTIRLLRFPFIILAALFGGLGLIAGFFLLLGHLLRLKSLGMPYLVPLFPFRTGNLQDSIFRASFQYLHTRSKFLRPLKLSRYKPSADKEDIDDE